MQHLDDDAELYALGLTGTDRVDEIEAHLAQCAECRARVVAAESVAASLSAALPPVPAAAAASPTPARSLARPAWFAPLAAAAALVFAATAAFEGSAAHATSARLAVTDTALLAIASSHFGHTTLSTDSGIIAKAIYARDGGWCYVVADRAPPGAHVVALRAGASRDLGPLAGAPATLFVRGAGKVDRIEIVAGDHIVAHGVPVY